MCYRRTSIQKFSVQNTSNKQTNKQTQSLAQISHRWEPAGVINRRGVMNGGTSSVMLTGIGSGHQNGWQTAAEAAEAARRKSLRQPRFVILMIAAHKHYPPASSHSPTGGGGEHMLHSSGGHAGLVDACLSVCVSVIVWVCVDVDDVAVSSHLCA